MTTFITEDWLRSNYSLSEGTEVQLPADCRMTPSARELINEHQLHVKFYDQQGRLFLEAKDSTEEVPVLHQAHVLTGQSEVEVGSCLLCHQKVTNKPDTLTQLNANTFVAKNDKRIVFRAQLDSAMALTIALQIDLKGSIAAAWLADIRSILGNVMRADATDEPLPSMQIAGIEMKTLHQLSHHPLKYLGHDHIVPMAEFGREVSQLNLLRTKLRETETFAAQAFISADFQVFKPDVMECLNRLSSAVYVMMILQIVHGDKHWPDAMQFAASVKKGGEHVG